MIGKVLSEASRRAPWRHGLARLQPRLEMLPEAEQVFVLVAAADGLVKIGNRALAPMELPPPEGGRVPHGSGRARPHHHVVAHLAPAVTLAGRLERATALGPHLLEAYQKLAGHRVGFADGRRPSRVRERRRWAAPRRLSAAQAAAAAAPSDPWRGGRREG